MAFPTTSVLDNFDRSNGPVGSNWTALFTGSGLEIFTNQIGNNGDTGAGEMYWNPITPGPDTEAYCTWATVASGSAIVLWARVGGSLPDTPNGYAAIITQGDTSVSINKVTAGSLSSIGSATITAPANGHKFGIEVTGSSTTTVTVYQNTSGSWASKGSATDSSSPWTGAGRIGISVVSTSDRVDDFGGGTISGAGPQTVSPTGISSAQAIGSLRVAGPVNLTGITSREAFGSPVVSLDAPPSGPPIFPIHA